MKVTLSKSDYKAGSQCLKRLYFQKYRPDIRKDDLGPSAKWRMHVGRQVGELARELYADGVLIEQMDRDIECAAGDTERLMAAGARCLYEATFVAGPFRAKVDVLRNTAPELGPQMRLVFDAGWDLIEVKQGKSPAEGEKPKGDYVHDAAFQTFVARESGASIDRIKLLLINRDYFHLGGNSYSAPDLLHEVDVTEHVEKVLPDVKAESLRMLDVLQGPEPKVEPNRYCSSPYKCPYYSHCHEGVPEHSILYLPQIRAKQIDELRADEVHTIDLIPDSYKLQAGQSIVRQSVRTGQPWVGEHLREALEAFEPPIHFIDFEAASAALPRFPNTQPHEAVPFQWSNHILDVGGELRHEEFLADGNGNPCAEFASSLLRSIRHARTIVIYTPYERTRVNQLMAANVPEARELFTLLEDRAIDLFKVVKDNFYHPNFQGSYSIKKVLPALVPHLSYEDLVIQEGETAAIEFLRSLDLDEPERDAVRRNLLAYCKRDTEAMVALYQALMKWC